ncbi:MAG TPA: type II toxin-antitoxin system RelE/ParE family toxin [Terriglobales bacterium]|nr:type II toxin-antitoxin system RelE/ParE family toxin [Terriglobales bacterium]
MAGKTLEIHPSALAEFKSALTWYLERNQTAAVKFAAEVERAISLVTESPARWPAGEHGTRNVTLRRFPFAIV